MSPWDNMDRIVCADSLFGIIKTATRQFPMVYLSNININSQRAMSELLTSPVDKTKLVLGNLFWMDQNMSYFIFNRILTDKGQLYTRM